MVKRFLALLPLLLATGCSVVGIRSGTEEPTYAVVDRIGDVEVRQYGPRVAAQTVTEGGEEETRNASFRRLADYIFGANRREEKITMTAPVAQEPAGGQTIAMTAPVAQDAVPGGWRMRFYLPADSTLANAPAPTDPQVELVTVPAEAYAVLRFTGSRSETAVAERTRELLDRLASSPWRPVGEPIRWFYDPPWTLPFLRRNEVAVAVERRDQPAS